MINNQAKEPSTRSSYIFKSFLDYELTSLLPTQRGLTSGKKIQFRKAALFASKTIFMEFFRAEQLRNGLWMEWIKFFKRTLISVFEVIMQPLVVLPHFHCIIFLFLVHCALCSQIKKWFAHHQKGLIQLPYLLYNILQDFS